ncbi:unnamed protein product [Caenorhabditis angaria]|uniref:Histone acetyltransferase n=1 Tax=Caenorhabditis angaria TaxID=860376 RepID=A0A9P1I6F3_9PELO|nr:unnamed protein product [Caenorhabditis angaria]
MSKIIRKRTRDEMNNGGNGSGQQITTNQNNIQNDSIYIGKCYMVERRADGKNPEKILATIIHVEWKDKNEEEASSSSSQEPQELTEEKSEESISTEGKTQMFYVHYEMLDRRMDEWVTRDRIFERIDAPQTSIIVPEIVTGTQNSGTEGVVGGMTANSSGIRGRALTRSQRRIHEEFNHMKQGYDSMDATTAKLEKEHEERTKVKNIPKITIGRHCITAWYYSPFPVHCTNHEIFMCEYCLLYTPSRTKFRDHYMTCKAREPPGNEIYRKDELSVYEIDGSCEKLYCQCLCLLSKLFMDHKTLYFDVDDFMFYVLCEVDDDGAHIVGYYSREVESTNNLACIMVFPPYQDKGYGKLLIQLSYEISNREGYVGTPEKPLSDLGKVSYRSYWWWVLLNVLSETTANAISASELSYISGIAVDDIVSTLTTMKLVRQYKECDYIIKTARKIIDHCIANDYGKKPRILLDKSALKWEPQVRRNVAIELAERRSSANLVEEILGDDLSSGLCSPNPSECSNNDDPTGLFC